MSTKQVQKKAKRAQASKQKKKAANEDRNLKQFSMGRRELARMAKTPEGIQAAEAKLRYDIATKGVVQTALDLKKDYEAAKAELNNVEVLKGINDMIPILGNIHGVIEVVEKLVEMKKITLTEEQQLSIDVFDRQIVAIAEDVNAIFVFINDEKEVDDYISLFVHYTDTLAEIMQFDIPRVMEVTLRPNELVINEYVREHMHEGESNYDFGMRLHGVRIARVAALYRTVKGAEPAAAEGTKPLVGDLVDEDAYEDIGAKQVN
jgi:hypothetical protein